MTRVRSRPWRRSLPTLTRGAVPSQLTGYPQAPGSGQLVPPLATYWVELAEQADVDGAGLGTGGTHLHDTGIPAPDVDFSVTGITITSPAARAMDFKYTLVAPNGQSVDIIPAPNVAGSNSVSGFTLPSGRGIWTIELRHVGTSAVTPGPRSRAASRTPSRT